MASGVRNPLRYGRLVELSTDFFQRNPLYDDRGQPINVPEWSFPGRGRVQRQLRRADTVMTFAEKLLTALPIRGKQAQLAARIEERHALAKRALGYVELYGAYTETDAALPGRQPHGAVGRLRRRGPRALRVRSRLHRLGPVRARDPPAVGPRAHPGAHEARAGRWWTSDPTGNARRSSRRTGISPSSTSSTRSCPPTWSTPTPGWPAATSRHRGGRASWPTWPARARPCSPSTGATAATSCAPSTGASRTRPLSSCGRTRGSCSTASC